jgi:hypothetical protein
LISKTFLEARQYVDRSRDGQVQTKRERLLKLSPRRHHRIGVDFFLLLREKHEGEKAQCLFWAVQAL